MEWEEVEEACRDCPPRLLEHIKCVESGQRKSNGRQKPNLGVYPELTSKPWFNNEEFSWTQNFLDNFEQIKNEYSSIRFKEDKTKETESFGEIKASTLGGEWTAFYLINQGIKMEENCSRCPQTTALIESLPGCMTGCGFAYAYFSVIQPGTHILPHHGVSNTKLRMQLCLQAPEDPLVSLRVGAETRCYKEGNLFIFDDSFDHEVLYPDSEQNKERVVLLVDFWHPDMTTGEKNVICRLLPPPDPSSVATTQ